MAMRDVDPGRRRIFPSAVALGAATCAAVAAIALVHEATRGRIAAHERARATAQLETLLAGLAHDNDVLGDVTYVRDPDLLGTRAAVPAYRVRLGGRPVAVVLSPVAPDGYIGSIELRVAIRADGRILAVRAVRHHETPGLGDAIDADKSDWIRRFTGRALGDPPLERWTVRREGGDFDQLTGATVTPRAVVHAVAASLLYFQKHRDELFAAPATIPP